MLSCFTVPLASSLPSAQTYGLREPLRVSPEKFAVLLETFDPRPEVETIEYAGVCFYTIERRYGAIGDDSSGVILTLMQHGERLADIAVFEESGVRRATLRLKLRAGEEPSEIEWERIARFEDWFAELLLETA